MSKCLKCEGCGQVANTDEQEPWTAWSSLPPGSDLAVAMGMVKPITCPACKGTCEQESPMRSESEVRREIARLEKAVESYEFKRSDTIGKVCQAIKKNTR